MKAYEGPINNRKQGAKLVFMSDRLHLKSE